MTVKLKYKCLLQTTANILHAKVVKDFIHVKDEKLLKKEDLKNLKIRQEAWKSGKVTFEWDNDNPKVFYMVINDPILEKDAEKEWKGESFKKKMALGFSRRYLQAHGITISFIK